ncbi:hypothetical protein GTY89_07965 [Streptomyces sp. SID5471]|uniref:hypothetical protein n=1 Tax=Streptomyces sp. SID5471 TaxID=2690298 RepID=UPI0002AC37E8|nr:hypothetical protein [Streptomyces sp. SID5471]
MTSTPHPGPWAGALPSSSPQPGDASSVGRAAASLTALRNVTVHAGVLEAAVALPEELQDPARGADDATAAIVAATVSLLRQAPHPDS